MGTYEKQYTINWCNKNYIDKSIIINYSKTYQLDNGETIKKEELLTLRGSLFDAYSEFPITAHGVETTMGELEEYLISISGKLKDIEIPVSSEKAIKFKNKAFNVLNNA